VGAPRDRPEVEIGAAVRAKRLRFRRVPETEVSFRGDPDPESRSANERVNLPDEVEEGVTYRDVEVRWAARAKARRHEP
jgi:hypothetical protein